MSEVATEHSCPEGKRAQGGSGFFQRSEVRNQTSEKKIKSSQETVKTNP